MAPPACIYSAAACDLDPLCTLIIAVFLRLLVEVLMVFFSLLFTTCLSFRYRSYLFFESLCAFCFCKFFHSCEYGCQCRCKSGLLNSLHLPTYSLTYLIFSLYPTRPDLWFNNVLLSTNCSTMQLWLWLLSVWSAAAEIIAVVHRMGATKSCLVITSMFVIINITTVSIIMIVTI